MADAKERARRERIIFRFFAHAAGLPVRSIRSRPEPEPDIRCTVLGEGAVAFELGEIVYPKFAQTTFERQPLRQRFAEEYAKLPKRIRSQLEKGLGGTPIVFVSFPDKTSPGKWRHAIPAILSVLAERAGHVASGQDLPVWEIQGLKDLILEMRVQRGPGPKAALHVMEMTEVQDQTLTLLEKKFRKHYESSAPIELIAYHLTQPPSGRHGTLESVAAFGTSHLDHLAGSQFRRVWIFDYFTRSIPLVLPPR
jgi:hypothetical protein